VNPEDPAYVERFREAYLFRNLLPHELQPFIENSGLADYSPNDMIISEGDAGEELFLILSGSVRVTKSTTEGIEQVIGFLREGDFFGEMALLDRRPRSASVFAHGNARLARLRHEDIYKIFRADPATGLKVVRTLAEVLSLRLRETNDRLKTVLLLESTF
jgi:CRP/FNR family cyclic AMP-dependent transcriptional regulator